MNLKLKTKQSQKQNQSQTQVIEQKIDEAYTLDREIKEKTEYLKKELKEPISEAAKKLDQHKLEGENATVEFSDETSTAIDPRALYQLCVDLGMEDAFFDMIKVQISAAKNKIGELHLEEVADTNVKKFAKMKFKAKK